MFCLNCHTRKPHPYRDLFEDIGVGFIMSTIQSVVAGTTNQSVTSSISVECVITYSTMQSIIPTTAVERVITRSAIYDIMCTPAIQRFIDVLSLHHQTCIIKRYSLSSKAKRAYR